MSKEYTQSSYPLGGKPSRTNYQPVPNRRLANFEECIDTEEYRRILPYHYLTAAKENDRLLTILDDSHVQFEHASPAELFGDARFALNALLAARHRALDARTIVNFQSGFRGNHHPIITSVSTQLSRSIQALDAYALHATGDIFIERSHWGSRGSKGNMTTYTIAPDIVIRDNR